MSVRLYGGLRHLRGGDVNDAVARATQAWVSGALEDLVPLRDVEGHVAATRRGVELGVDVIVHVTPRIGVVGGVGRIESSSYGRLETPERPALYPSRTSTALRVRAVPLRLGLQYTHPVGGGASLLMEGGAGFYFTRHRWLQRFDVNPPRKTDLRTDTRGRALGVHGGVWLDVSLSDRTGLVIGVHGTRASVGRLEGFREGAYSYRPPTRDDGRLQLVDPEWARGWHFLVVGEGTRTADRFGPLTTVGDARVGLGGLRLSSGLRFRF